MSFTARCDQCGSEFQSNAPLWPNYQKQHDENNQLQLVLSTGGFPPKWHCSEECQLENTRELRTAIKETYGESCECGAKIGETHIQPCQECNKLICDNCQITGKGGSHERYCSTTCSETKTNCKRCNRRIPTDQEYCEHCE